MKVHSAVSMQTFMEKDAAALSLVVVAARLVTPMMVALAEKMHKLWPKVVTDEVLVSH
jgi:hypothetical protein